MAINADDQRKILLRACLRLNTSLERLIEALDRSNLKLKPSLNVSDIAVIGDIFTSYLSSIAEEFDKDSIAFSKRWSVSKMPRYSLEIRSLWQLLRDFKIDLSNIKSELNPNDFNVTSCATTFHQMRQMVESLQGNTNSTLVRHFGVGFSTREKLNRIELLDEMFPHTKSGQFKQLAHKYVYPLVVGGCLFSGLSGFGLSQLNEHEATLKNIKDAQGACVACYDQLSALLQEFAKKSDQESRDKIKDKIEVVSLDFSHHIYNLDDSKDIEAVRIALKNMASMSSTDPDFVGEGGENMQIILNYLENHKIIKYLFKTPENWPKGSGNSTP